MLKLYEAADRIEAQLLMDFLRGSHIDSVLLGDYLSGAAGELPANSFPVVWVVEDGDLPRARLLLRDFHSLRAGEQHAAVAPWVCHVCGAEVDSGFVICWNCGRAKE